MIDRLFKSGIITTFIGLFIILLAVSVWAFGEAKATEAVTIAGIGTGLLFLKDKHIGLNERNK